jgi:hypothetical protein
LLTGHFSLHGLDGAEDGGALVHLAGVHLHLAGYLGAVLADGRQDMAGHPVLEQVGVRLVGAEGQLVAAALRDEQRRLSPHTRNLLPVFLRNVQLAWSREPWTIRRMVATNNSFAPA